MMYQLSTYYFRFHLHATLILLRGQIKANLKSRYFFHTCMLLTVTLFIPPHKYE